MAKINIEKRKSVLFKWCSIKSISMRKIAKEENLPVSSVSYIIKKFGETNTIHNLPKSGRKKGSFDQEKSRRVMEIIKKKRELSVRDIAKKAKTSIGMVQRVKARNNLKTYKKQKQPKRDEKQSSKAKTRTKKLYDFVNQRKNHCIIMDDETYVKLDFKTLPGPQYYTIPKGSKIPRKDRSVFCEKFGQKIMVWQAICQCGKKSKAFFTNKSINSEIYIKECLQKRLLPLIKKHNGPTLFWPDLASCHYSKATQEWYIKNCVTFIEKDINPPNCPELRPIERYWAIMKRHLQQKVKSANSVKDFEEKWNQTAKKMDESSVQTLMGNLPSKLLKFYRNNDNFEF